MTNTVRAAASPLACVVPSNTNAYARAWFRLAQQRWTSIALVPASRSLAIAPIANGIAAAATSYGEPVSVIVALHLAPAAVYALRDELTQRTALGGKTIVAIGSPLADAGLISVARATDACILVVGLGRATTAEARETIACIGSERFVGSFAVS